VINSEFVKVLVVPSNKYGIDQDKDKMLVISSADGGNKNPSSFTATQWTGSFLSITML
jgi:hypothetical protein